MGSSIFFALTNLADVQSCMYLGFLFSTTHGVKWLLGIRQERFSHIVIIILVKHLLDLIFFIWAFDCWGWLVQLVLKSADSEFEKLVLSLRLKHLLMQEVSLLLKVIRSALPFLYLLSLIILFFLHSILVISQASDGLLEIIDLLVFSCVI